MYVMQYMSTEHKFTFYLVILGNSVKNMTTAYAALLHVFER